MLGVSQAAALLALTARQVRRIVRRFALIASARTTRARALVRCAGRCRINCPRPAARTSQRSRPASRRRWRAGMQSQAATRRSNDGLMTVSRHTHPQIGHRHSTTSGYWWPSTLRQFDSSDRAVVIRPRSTASGSSPCKAGSTGRGIGADEQRERPKAKARQLVRHRTDVRAGPA